MKLESSALVPYVENTPALSSSENFAGKSSGMNLSIETAATEVDELLMADYVYAELEREHNFINILNAFNVRYTQQGYFTCVADKQVSIVDGIVDFWVGTQRYEWHHSGAQSPAYDRQLGSSNPAANLLSEVLGIPLAQLWREILRRMGWTVHGFSRYLYARERTNTKFPADSDLLWRIQPLKHPHSWNFQQRWAYFTLDGKYIHFGTVQFEYKEFCFKLPCKVVSLRDSVHYFVFDHPMPPYPLYDQHILHNNQTCNALICACEDDCEYIKTYHKYLLKNAIPTTWSGGMACSIKDTDWGYLTTRSCKVPLIFVSPLKEGFVIANEIYISLKRAGIQDVGFTARNAGLRCGVYNRDAFDMDTARVVSPGAVHNYERFVAEAKQLFDLNFGNVSPEMGLNGHDLMRLGTEPTRYVIKPFVREGDKVMVYGGSGCAKSWFVTVMATAITSGKGLFQGEWPCDRPRNVVIFYGEMSTHEISGRYQNIANQLETTAHDKIRVITVDCMKRMMRLDTKDDRAPFEALLTWSDVIIVDPAYKSFPTAMGNDIAGVQPLLDFMDNYCSRGKTIFIVDHAGKDIKRGAIGSAGKSYSFDLIWSLAQTKTNHFSLGIEKFRAQENTSINNIRFKLITNVETETISLQLLPDISKDSTKRTIDTTSVEEPSADVIDIAPDKSSDIDSDMDEAETIPDGNMLSLEDSEVMKAQPPQCATREERKSMVKEYFLTHCEASMRDAEQYLGISKSTIGELKNELIASGELPGKNTQSFSG